MPNNECFDILPGPVFSFYLLETWSHLNFNLSSCAECSDCGREKAIQAHCWLCTFKIPCSQSDYQTGICIHLHKLLLLLYADNSFPQMFRRTDIFPVASQVYH